MARIRWSLTARRDLREIREYIGADSPAVGIHVARRIILVIRHLREFPKLGRLVEGRSDPSLRVLVSDNYRIFYASRDDDIVVVRIIHSARDIRPMTFREN